MSQAGSRAGRVYCRLSKVRQQTMKLKQPQREREGSTSAGASRRQRSRDLQFDVFL